MCPRWAIKWSWANKFSQNSFYGEVGYNSNFHQRCLFDLARSTLKALMHSKLQPEIDERTVLYTHFTTIAKFTWVFKTIADFPTYCAPKLSISSFSALLRFKVILQHSQQPNSKEGNFWRLPGILGSVSLKLLNHTFLGLDNFRWSDKPARFWIAQYSQKSSLCLLLGFDSRIWYRTRTWIWLRTLIRKHVK